MRPCPGWTRPPPRLNTKSGYAGCCSASLPVNSRIAADGPPSRGKSGDTLRSSRSAKSMPPTKAEKGSPMKTFQYLHKKNEWHYPIAGTPLHETQPCDTHSTCDAEIFFQR